MYLTSVLSTATYRAFIDGVSVQSLFPDSFNALACTDGNCEDTEGAAFGIRVRIGGPGAISTMGITVQFVLSPGDAATVSSLFDITAIREPSTAAALGLGLAGLALSRRRRSV